MTNAEDIRECVHRNGDTFDFSEVLFDGALLKASCDEVYSMFDREVFDYVIGIGGSTGIVLASHVATRMGKGLVALYTSDDCPSRIEGVDGRKVVIIGDSLTDGVSQKNAVDLIERSGGNVIKMGFLSEIKEVNARKKMLRPYPVESLIIY